MKSPIDSSVLFDFGIDEDIKTRDMETIKMLVDINNLFLVRAKRFMCLCEVIVKLITLKVEFNL